MQSSKVPVNWNPEFAILISSTAAGLARSSQLYFGRPCLDFQIDKEKCSLVLRSMRCLDYTSKLEKPAESDLFRISDPEGKPDVCIWQTLSFNYGGRHRDFIHSLCHSSFYKLDISTDHYPSRSHGSRCHGSADRLATLILRGRFSGYLEGCQKTEE